MGKKLLIGGIVILAVIVVVGGVAWLGTNKSISYSNNSPTTPAATGVPIETGSLNLTITSPVSGIAVKTASVAVLGKTIPNAEVEVNDNYLYADAKGNFNSTVTLEAGDNYISVMAVDDNGQTAERELAVNYQTQ